MKTRRWVALLILTLLFVQQGRAQSVESVAAESVAAESVAASLQPRLTDQTAAEFTTSTLPIVMLNTNGQEIVDVPRIIASMGIIDNGTGGVNKVGDPFNVYDGRISIEIRGASSQAFPKKQFALETQDEDGENLNVSLLGLPDENDWILQAPYSDKSLIRNILAYGLARDMGRYASRTRLCEVVINGDYRGVYVLMEKIKRDNDRVDIKEIEPEDAAGVKLTGGYILKIDKMTGDNNEGWPSPYPPYPGAYQRILYQYHDPAPDEITDPQRAYIQAVIDTFETFMAQPDITGYEQVIDVDSFVDFFLINELGRNVDGYRLSTFFYKDRDNVDGRLVMGPIWDFNLAFGNANYYDGSAIEGLQVFFQEESDGFQIPFWWRRLMNDPDFLNRIHERWINLRRTTWSTDRIMAKIDLQVAQLQEPAKRNFARWPVLGRYVWPNVFIGESYEAEVAYLKDWVRQRLTWMDGAVPTLVEQLPDQTDPFALSIYPNPTGINPTVSYVLANEAYVTIEVYDALGRLVETVYDGYQLTGEHIHQMSMLDRRPAGMYLIRLRFGDWEVSRKIVKLNL